MKLLALDTATEACSAAVLVDGEITSRFELVSRRHGELILDMIDQVLAEAGLEPADLDALAFGRGPGSFTGVRIAASVAQGIAFAVDLPVVPVSTLAALALGTGRQHGVNQVASALDARMGEVYWGLYTVDGDEVRLVGQERVIEPAIVPVPPPSAGEANNWYGAGSGWQTYAAVLRQRLPVTDAWPQRYPDAADIAKLGAAMARQGQTVAAELALPVYLRDQVASKAGTAGTMRTV